MGLSAKRLTPQGSLSCNWTSGTTLQKLLLHLDMSTPKRPELHLDVLHYIGLCAQNHLFSTLVTPSNIWGGSCNFRFNLGMATTSAIKQLLRRTDSRKKQGKISWNSLFRAYRWMDKQELTRVDFLFLDCSRLKTPELGSTKRPVHESFA